LVDIKNKKSNKNNIFDFCQEILQDYIFIDKDKLYKMFGFCICGNKLTLLDEYYYVDLTQKTLCVILPNPISQPKRQSTQIIPRFTNLTSISDVSEFILDCKSLQKDDYYLAFFPCESENNDIFDRYMVFQNEIRTLFINRYNYAYSQSDDKEQFLFLRYVNIIKNLKLISLNIDIISIQDIIEYYLLAEGKILSENNITIEQKIVYLLNKNKTNTLYHTEIIFELFINFKDVIDEIIEINLDNNEIIFGKILLIKNIQYLPEIKCQHVSKFIKNKFFNIMHMINVMSDNDINILSKFHYLDDDNDTISEKKKKIFDTIIWRFKTLF